MCLVSLLPPSCIRLSSVCLATLSYAISIRKKSTPLWAEGRKEEEEEDRNLLSASRSSGRFSSVYSCLFVFSLSLFLSVPLFSMKDCFLSSLSRDSSREPRQSCWESGSPCFFFFMTWEKRKKERKNVHQTLSRFLSSLGVRHSCSPPVGFYLVYLSDLKTNDSLLPLRKSIQEILTFSV